jgi:hypothetical protein
VHKSPESCAIANAKPVIELVKVALYRTLRDVQSASYFLVGKPLSDQLHNFALSCRSVHYIPFIFSLARHRSGPDAEALSASTVSAL